MGFGQRLNSILLEEGITPAQLSKMLGWNTGALSQYLNSQTREPKLSNAAKIADALGISLDYLAGRDGYGKHGPLSVSMAPDERKLVDDYRECTPRERQAIANMASTMADDGNAKNMDATGSAAMGA